MSAVVLSRTTGPLSRPLLAFRQRSILQTCRRLSTQSPFFVRAAAGNLSVPNKHSHSLMNNTGGSNKVKKVLASPKHHRRRPKTWSNNAKPLSARASDSVQNRLRHNPGLATQARSADASEVLAPTTEQLRRHLAQKAIPMIGFGFMDQTIMLQVGDLFDCTLGVTFGLSTLSAAAFGQIVSNAGSVLFGGAVERAATAMGVPSPHFTSAQRHLPIVQRTSIIGTLVGVVVGCTLGLVNLLFIDTRRSQQLKILASIQNQPYVIEASNGAREDATLITVRGPDRDGLLAIITGVFQQQGHSIVEVTAHPLTASNNEDPKQTSSPSDDETSKTSFFRESASVSSVDSVMIEDEFVIQHKRGPIPDDQLQVVIEAIQDAISGSNINASEPSETPTDSTQATSSSDRTSQSSDNTTQETTASTWKALK